jgi:hypothetical protein
MYFRREPSWQKELIKKIAKDYGLDIRIVRQMVYYPLLFTKYKIASTEDWNPIRHRHLGVFTTKTLLMKKYREKKANESV